MNDDICILTVNPQPGPQTHQGPDGRTIFFRNGKRKAALTTIRVQTLFIEQGLDAETLGRATDMIRLHGDPKVFVISKSSRADLDLLYVDAKNAEVDKLLLRFVMAAYNNDVSDQRVILQEARKLITLDQFILRFNKNFTRPGRGAPLTEAIVEDLLDSPNKILEILQLFAMVSSTDEQLGKAAKRLIALGLTTEEIAEKINMTPDYVHDLMART